MKQTILITTIFFTLFSCKKTYVPFEITCTLTQDSSLVKQYIKGTWEWVEEKRYSQASGKLIYLTPKTEGYTSRMIINDSTLSWYENSDKTDYKFKIQLWGEISGTNFPQDKLTVLVMYDNVNGNRKYFVPIKICSEFLEEQRGYVSSYAGIRIWKKQ